MADGTLAVTEGSGVNLDVESLTVGSNTVKRQRVQVYGAGDTDALTLPAHDAVDTGNPLKIGGKAALSTPTAVAAADRVNAWYDPEGSHHIVNVPEPNRIWIPGIGRTLVSRTNGTFSAPGNGTGVQVIAAPASGVYTYVIGFSMSHNDSSVRYLRFINGASGSALWSSYAAGGTPLIVGPGNAILVAPSSATALYAEASAALSIFVNVTYFQTTVVL